MVPLTLVFRTEQKILQMGNSYDSDCPILSPLTRDDFTFNGLDIVVGDWVAGATSGLCWKVILAGSKNNNPATVC